MSQSEDAISALLPVKNGQMYLEKLLPNILAMLSSQDELIIVNDGSTDQTQSLIEKYRLQDPRITLINTSGVGLVSALNLGVQIVKNKWIARFDVDDRYLDIRILEQRKYLCEDVAVVFSDYQFLSERGRGLGYVYSAVLAVPAALSLVSGQRTAHPSALINREMLDKAGGYRLQDFPVEDLALWLRISEFGKIISAPLPLLGYRLSGNSISGQNRKIQQAKKQELIRSFPSWNVLHERSVEDFSQTLTDYRAISHAPERILLHLRDLLLVGSLTKTKVPVLRILFEIRLLLLLRIVFAAVRLCAAFIYRRLFRFMHQ
jgi:glycosyltransferase involved in cell wall biosynthesis